MTDRSATARGELAPHTALAIVLGMADRAALTEEQVSHLDSRTEEGFRLVTQAAEEHDARAIVERVLKLGEAVTIGSRPAHPFLTVLQNGYVTAQGVVDSWQGGNLAHAVRQLGDWSHAALAAIYAERAQESAAVEANRQLVAVIQEALTAYPDSFDGGEAELNSTDLHEWFSGWRDQAKAAIGGTPLRTDHESRAVAALWHLREALALLKIVGAKRTIARVQLAISSARGAIRNAVYRDQRAREAAAVTSEGAN